jgi:hypothetical protein
VEERHRLSSAPAQREESAKISAAAAEVARIKQIGDDQRTFDLDELEKFKLSSGNGDGKGEQNRKKVQFVQKYSEPGLLAESVIVDGISYFAVSRLRSRANPRDAEIVLETSIPIDDKREYKPFEVSSYLNQPYRFSSKTLNNASKKPDMNHLIVFTGR